MRIFSNTIHTHTKKNSKKIKGLNVRADTMKLLGENKGRTLIDMNHSTILLDAPPNENKQMGPN